MEKILEGNLAHFEVPDLLSLVKAGRRTGVLALERRDQESKLYFRAGNPVFAASTREDLRLGRLLVRQGKVPAEVIDEALEWQHSNGGRLGSALLAAGMLEESELAALLKVQVSEVIFDAFSWPEGAFSFWDRVPPPPNAVTLEMDVQNILIEGVRRLDVRERLKSAFPDLDMVVEGITNPERVKHSVTLTPDEWKILFLVDGRRSLSEICHLAGDAEDQATLNVLYTLQMARFVSVVAPARPAQDEAPAALPPPVSDPYQTQKLKPPAVEFASPVRSPKQEDDTRQIVSPKAVQYLANVQKVTVSRLILVTDGRETSFPLTGDTYTLGRHKNNDISVADPKVSSFHARIDRSPDGFVLVDLGSRNGTFVNGKRIESGILKTGDEVRLGTARLLYKVDYTTAVS
jgi:pSer/pThr/pTyr-binding forkhead associated (FHA) protein